MLENSLTKKEEHGQKKSQEPEKFIGNARATRGTGISFRLPVTPQVYRGSPGGSGRHHTKLTAKIIKTATLKGRKEKKNTSHAPSTTNLICGKLKNAEEGTLKDNKPGRKKSV